MYTSLVLYFLVGDSWIEHHEIQNPGDTVTMSCDNATLHLLNSNNAAMIWEGSVYTVTHPSHQAKFVCLLEEEVVKVHYVEIKGIIITFLNFQCPSVLLLFFAN